MATLITLVHIDAGLTSTGLRTCFSEMSRFVNLRKLILGGCRVDDAVCASIAASCPALTSLDLWNCPSIGNTGVMALMQSLPLQELNLRESTSMEGSVICDTFRAALPLKLNLHTLDVSFVSNLEDAHLTELLTQTPPSLKFLACGGDRCSVTEITLHKLPVSLTALDLTECSKLVDFSALEKLRSMNSLNLDGCSISSEQLVGICAACPLTSLSLADCKGVNDDTLLEIARLLPDLFGIELRGCVNIGTSATYSHCASVDALVKSCRLTHLGLDGCSNVSGEVVEAVRRALPMCDVVWSGNFDDY